MSMSVQSIQPTIQDKNGLTVYASDSTYSMMSVHGALSDLSAQPSLQGPSKNQNLSKTEQNKLNKAAESKKAYNRKIEIK